jgi:hypothetical protein
LNDDPAPPAALVVELVDVIVVVWLRPDETLVAPAVGNGAKVLRLGRGVGRPE